jgi:hypothetical protein
MRIAMLMRISVSIILTFSIAMYVLPPGTDATGNEAIVRVDYSGPYWGTIKGDWEEGIEHEGVKEFTMTGDIIYVIVNKADDSNDEMKVSIIVDGDVRVSDSTTDPEGTVRLSLSFGEPLDDDDESGDGGSEKQICTTSTIGSALVLFTLVVLLSSIKRR